MDIERLLAPRHKRPQYRDPVVIYEGSTARLGLTQGREALVDADVARLVGHKAWSFSHGYAFNGSGRQKMYLHRVVMSLAGLLVEGMEVDHISGDTLDNRRTNLRMVTRRDNQLNKRLTTGRRYRGVTWDKRHNRWIAVIKRRDVTKFLGYFDSEPEAALAYDRAAISHGGTYRLNFGEER